MFRYITSSLARLLSDAIDDMLLGDYDYILVGNRLYADVDYFHAHPHHAGELTWTPAAGRGFGPQRSVGVGPVERRAGSVPPSPGACLVRPPRGRAQTAAGGRRAARN